MNLKQIIRAECACYFWTGPYGAKDWCEPRDRRCVAFGKFQRCRYFEEGVLPVQPDASAEYVDLCEKALGGERGEAPQIRNAPNRSREGSRTRQPTKRRTRTPVSQICLL